MISISSYLGLEVSLKYVDIKSSCVQGIGAKLPNCAATV